MVLERTTDIKLPLICTFTGKRFNPLDPDPELIDIEDIAHGLSNVCRYGGQCKEFFSVAQHSTLVAASILRDNGSWDEAKWGLLHDAPEAYIGDIVAPLKVQEEYTFYREAEDNLMEAIAERFGLVSPMPEIVKKHDLIVRETEMRDFGSVPKELRGHYDVLPGRITPKIPSVAKREYIWAFEELFDQ